MRERPDKLVLVLALLCAGTAAVALLAEADIPAGPATPAKTNNESLAGDPDFVESAQRGAKQKPRDAYAEMLRRPLFNATRRPVDQSDAPVPVQSTAQAPARSNHRLVGAVIIDDRRFALINDPTTGKTERVAVGEETSGWKVTDLTPGSATITRGTQSKTIELERKSSPRRAERRRAENKNRLAATPPSVDDMPHENENDDDPDTPSPDEP